MLGICSGLITLRPCQHDIGYIDDRSQTDERTRVHSARSSLVITDSSTSRDRRALSVNVPDDTATAQSVRHAATK